MYQQYQNKDGQTFYALIEFITVYLYYAYLDKKRPRIRLEHLYIYVFYMFLSSSHALVLLPYRRKSHGRRLLTIVYDNLKNHSHSQDITGLKFIFIDYLFI